MGAIRWTGKGLQLLGKVLATEEFEKWLEEYGKELVEDKLQTLSIKWLFPETRAKKAAFVDASSIVNKSETFRLALEKSLALLPKLLSNISQHVKRRGPKELIREVLMDWIAVIPRGVVQTVYANEVLGRLAKSAELSRFEGFPEIFLQKKARDSEIKFFNFLLKDNVFFQKAVNGIVCGVDPSFGWRFQKVDAHYYYAHSYWDKDFTKRSTRREFLEKINPELDRLKENLGTLTSTQIGEITN